MIEEQKKIEDRLLNLKLRIWYAGNPEEELKMTEVTIKKNQTLGELFLLVCDTLEIKDVELKNFRLRLYDPKLKVKMGVQDQHTAQLHKLNFVNYLDLIPEIKTSETTFETYNPDTAYLRVLKFVDGEIFDHRAIDKMQWHVL